jgi:hypothetical protein
VLAVFADPREVPDFGVEHAAQPLGERTLAARCASHGPKPEAMAVA